jgi:hypothetical protein
MPATINYDLRKTVIEPTDLIRYDQREKAGVINQLVDTAKVETIVTPAGMLTFDSHEIRRAVEMYGEEFCLFVEDTFAAFWAARKGTPSIGLPIWLQGSKSDYTAPAVEAAMGEAVGGFVMEVLYGGRLHHRPRGRAPDFYMVMPNGTRATVEVKATVRSSASSLRGQLINALGDMVTMWAHIDSVQSLQLLQGFCIGVAIGQEQIRVRVLRIEFVP